MRALLLVGMTALYAWVVHLQIFFGKEWVGFCVVTLFIVLLLDHLILKSGYYRFYVSRTLIGKAAEQQAFSKISLIIFAYGGMCAINDESLNQYVKSFLSLLTCGGTVFAVQVLHETLIGRISNHGP
jgi:hypothetical protein